MLSSIPSPFPPAFPSLLLVFWHISSSARCRFSPHLPLLQPCQPVPAARGTLSHPCCPQWRCLRRAQMWRWWPAVGRLREADLCNVSVFVLSFLLLWGWRAAPGLSLFSIGCLLIRAVTLTRTSGATGLDRFTAECGSERDRFYSSIYPSMHTSCLTAVDLAAHAALQIQISAISSKTHFWCWFNWYFFPLTCPREACSHPECLRCFRSHSGLELFNCCEIQNNVVMNQNEKSAPSILPKVSKLTANSPESMLLLTEKACKCRQPLLEGDNFKQKIWFFFFFWTVIECEVQMYTLTSTYH